MNQHINSKSNPVRKSNRIELLDVFRGFAVLGIFVVNIEIMNCMFMHEEVFTEQWTSTLDKVVKLIRQLFFYSKFFPIFSFLFGVGIALQALRMQDRGERIGGFFFRRMLVLFLLGCAHITFFWGGDVIHLYALMGMLIALMLKIPTKLLPWLALSVLLFPFYGQMASAFYNLVGLDPSAFLEVNNGDYYTDVVRSGSYIDGIKLRWLEYVSNSGVLLVFLAPLAFAMFVLGLYAGKKGWVHHLEQTALQLKTPMLITITIATLYRIVFLFFRSDFLPYLAEGFHPYVFQAMQLADVFTGLFFLWGIASLWKYKRVRNVLSVLKPVGRMALTNYILQSVVGMFLFTSVGFSWYLELSPPQTFALACVVYAFQIVLSHYWLVKFKYGPLEWLWRCLTYQKILPIR